MSCAPGKGLLTSYVVGGPESGVGASFPGTCHSGAPSGSSRRRSYVCSKASDKFADSNSLDLGF